MEAALAGGAVSGWSALASVLEPASWHLYAATVQQRQHNVENAVLGHIKQKVPPVQVPPADQVGW